MVLAHDPTFALRAIEEGERLRRALGEAVVDVHHIGSTALPIAAKALLDLLLVVRDVSTLDADCSLATMTSLGYAAHGEYGIAGRRFFTRVDGAGERTHNLHAFEVGSPEIDRHLDFRDYLRAHPEQAAQYGALKQRLAAAQPTDIDAYMDGKDAFIKDVDARAAEWRARGP
ncbi:MAG: GrpB family protein [Polyangiales bacterium]